MYDSNELFAEPKVKFGPGHPPLPSQAYKPMRFIPKGRQKY